MGIKLRFVGKEKNGVTSVKGMVKHPMLSYDQAKRQGKKANFITYMKVTQGGDVVFEASTSQFLSKNPIFKFKFKGGKKGEKFTVYVEDLLGNKAEKSFPIR